MQHSFIAIPENDYEPRLTDHRMGFFSQQVTDLTDTSVTLTEILSNAGT
ncbi:MAG: hypothetical protein CM1200mP36_00310 [Gammaproteobacteria bacterium]|nr:MAG: hypothetical protein CM1200mP36_00310 [Gammaproteobacteria bacterium]